MTLFIEPRAGLPRIYYCQSLALIVERERGIGAVSNHKCTTHIESNGCDSPLDVLSVGLMNLKPGVCRVSDATCYNGIVGTGLYISPSTFHPRVVQGSPPTADEKASSAVTK